MEANAEILNMEKTKILLEMGFDEDEIFDAIDIFGHEVSTCELADSIFASRIARRPDYDKEEESHDYHRRKKVRNTSAAGFNEASCSRNGEEWKQPSSCRRIQNSTETGSANAERPFPKEQTPRSLKPGWPLRGSPYLFFGSTIGLPQEMWRRASLFLDGIEPELVNTHFFSALIREEGYLHNLPRETRARLFPGSPTTIEEALPHTKKWWPPWDARKQLTFIQFDPSQAALLCDDLQNMLRRSQGMPSKEERAYLLHQSKKMSLVWVAENKLSPLEPHQMETILGYPNQHTDIFGIGAGDRMKKLAHSFQVDTLAYHLSALKGLYPKGMRVLSIADGIGGAEIALHRLGIRLASVVAVEEDETSRKIMKRWWKLTGQTGELLQVDGLEKLTTKKLESVIERFGGLDLVVGGWVTGFGDPKTRSTEDLDMGVLYEYFRVFQQVRRIARLI